MSDATSRKAALGAALLKWIADNEDREPNPSEFLKVPESVIGGVQATIEEIERAALYLYDAELVKGITSLGHKSPSRVSLTPKGRIATF